MMQMRESQAEIDATIAEMASADDVIEALAQQYARHGGRRFDINRVPARHRSRVLHRARQIRRGG